MALLGVPVAIVFGALSIIVLPGGAPIRMALGIGAAMLLGVVGGLMGGALMYVFYRLSDIRPRGSA